MNFQRRNQAATIETALEVDSEQDTCGGIVKGAVPQQQVVVLAYPMQLAAPVTLQASTDIVESCQTACCSRIQEH